MVVTFDKNPPEYIESDYVLVWVPQRRHTDSVMTRPVIHKARSRMYHQGHYAKVKRPTGPELYEDASRILDELLQKQLNDQRRSHGRPPRFRTHPMSAPWPVTSGEVLDERDEEGLEDGIGGRCKTMPSRIRGASRDEALLPKDLDALRKKADQHEHRAGNGSVSSADTEGDSASVSENRKKKGLLRRAKDRFLHSFHRQEREKENRLKDNDSPKVSPKKQAKKVPRKKTAVEQNGVAEKGDKYEVGDNKEAGQPSHNDGYGKRRNSASKMLNSIRKSFRSKKDDRHVRSPSVQEGRGADDKRPSVASSSSTSRRSHHQEPTPPPPRPHHAPETRHTDPSGDPPEPPTGPSLSVPAPDRKGSAQDKSASPYPHSSSTDSHLGSGGMTSSLPSSASRQTNVLDFPGEDIQFMDMGGGQGDHSLHNGHGGAAAGDKDGSMTEGRPGLWDRQQSLCVDGDVDTQDGRGGPPPGGTEDVPIHERTAQEKEEMYGKIAQKLIHIADSFAAESGLSEGEGHAREGAAAARAGPEGDGVLSDLEKQILACLRDAGDRNASVMDSQAEEVIQQTKAQTYERFKATVQQSLGNDVSWNQLAFLFYTTKGVVSAVGVGSKMASEAKEMTLHYFSDKFAKWLMDQGGFDSVLSESDSELD